MISDFKEVINKSESKNNDKLGTATIMAKILRIAEEFYKEMKENKRQEGSVNDWKLVSMVIDRLFLIIFTVLAVVLAVVIITRNGPYDDDVDLENV